MSLALSSALPRPTCALIYGILVGHAGVDASFFIAPTSTRSSVANGVEASVATSPLRCCASVPRLLARLSRLPTLRSSRFLVARWVIGCRYRRSDGDRKRRWISSLLMHSCRTYSMSYAYMLYGVALCRIVCNNED